MSNYLNSCNDVLTTASADRIYSARPTSTYRPDGTFIDTLNVWFQRWQQRRRLENLPPHLLKDIGITSYAAEQEAAKPFWIE